MYGETGLISNTNVSVNGGTERTGMYFSASRKSEEGIVKNSGYLNNSVRMNIDHQLNDRISLALRATYMNTSADRGLTNNDNNSVTYGVSLATIPEYLELHPDATGNYPTNPAAANPRLKRGTKMRNNRNHQPRDHQRRSEGHPAYQRPHQYKADRARRHRLL